MLKINRKLEYALMALKYMAEKAPGELTSAREICERFHTPFDTTAKVMQMMNNHAILTSVKGIKGGYKLAISLGELTYGKLEEIIEGREAHNLCYTNKGLCELHNLCNIIGPVQKMNSKINEFLQNITLQELFFESSHLTSFNLSNKTGESL